MGGTFDMAFEPMVWVSTLLRQLERLAGGSGACTLLGPEGPGRLALFGGWVVLNLLAPFLRHLWVVEMRGPPVL